MCGIATIFSYLDGPPVNESELLAIRDRMMSRGPDGDGLWISEDRRIGLAHRRLAILDLSPSGAQPMFDESGKLGITFNGEIYNYRELRAQLEGKGFRFRSGTDTEVLLYLYADRGMDMVQSLRGMYAFAIWDELRKGLFLARDPYGIKPLYYADDGKTFRAASQVKALLAGGQIDTRPNPAGHAGFFLWGHIPDPHTLYRGIQALPAGHCIWMQHGGRPALSSFCSIPAIFAETVSGNGHHSYKDPLREALHDTVRRHLISDVPVGVFLSSGVDSTVIAALAAEEGGTLQTVTLAFEEYKGTANDEAPLAEEVAHQYGADHRTVRITRRDFQEQLDHFFWSMDQPTIDGVNTYWVSRITAQAGLKVALSGLGGDELFGGYPSFRHVPKMVRTFSAFDMLKPLGRGFRIVSAPLLKHFTSPKYAGVFEYGGNYAGAYLLRRGLYMPWELADVLDADVARQGWRDLQAIANVSREIAGIRTPRSTVACLESCWYMRHQLLRDSDWAGMAHSLEIRVPLVDIEFLRSTARWMGTGQTPGKRALIEAPLWPLPDAVFSRPKTGFTVPMRQWLSTDSGRGLRSWAKTVYAQFQSNGRPPGSAARSKGNVSASKAPTGL
jgi:asparagine synthase (glutamine-hydrolysing)